jgi:dTDP-4-dehydrorhamnose reductase
MPADERLEAGEMPAAPRPAVWAGIEPSYLTVAGQRRDQLAETGHADRLEDLDRLAELGVTAVRYPLLWGRGGTETDWAWAGARVDRLVSLGIAPIAGLLHHGWGPETVDPLDPDYPTRFASYAVQVAQRFPAIRTFLPINEPLTTARFAGLYGWWDPRAQDDATFARLLVAQCLAIRAATRGLRRLDPTIRTLVNEDAGQTFGTPDLAHLVDHYNHRRWLTYDLLTGRVDRHHPLWETLVNVPGIAEGLEVLADDPEPPDILGVDHYATSDRFLDHRVDRYPPDVPLGQSQASFVDVELVRVAGFEVDGFWSSLRQTWERYGLPLALTEVHLGGAPEDEVLWWAEAWRDATSATQAGIEVQAVTSWAAFGAYDWDALMRHQAGSYRPGCFDARTATPTMTALGRAVAATASGRPPTPVPTGWWRQPHRVRFPLDPAVAA